VEGAARRGLRTILGAVGFPAGAASDGGLRLVSKLSPDLYVSFFSWKEKLFLLELSRGKFSLRVLPDFLLTALLCFCKEE